MIYDAIAGSDGRDPVSLSVPAELTLPGLKDGVKGLKICYVRNLDPGDAAPEPAILEALAKSAVEFAELGADVIEIDLPIAPSEYRSIAMPINRAESFSIHERDHLEHRHLMGRSLREKLDTGMYLRAADYLAALRQRRVLVARTDEVFSQVDVLLLPNKM